MAKMTSAEYIKELASSQLTREQLNKLLDRNNISYELGELDNFGYAVLNGFKGKKSDFSAQREGEYMTGLSKGLSQKVKDIDNKIVSLESTKKELDKMPGKVLATVDAELISVREDQKVYNAKTLQNLAKKAEKKHGHDMSEIKGIDKQFSNLETKISDRPTRDEVSDAMNKNFVTKDNTFTKEETRNYVKSKLNNIVIPGKSGGSGGGSGGGTGDVVGPATSVNQNIAVYDGITGKLIKDSSVNVSAIIANNDKVTNATHTGEVTGATALTIAANAVTNAKAAQMATKTYKGRTTAGTGNSEDVSVATLKTDLALNLVDNTSDADKPVSTAQQTALNLKANLSGGNNFVGGNNSFTDNVGIGTASPLAKLHIDQNAAIDGLKITGGSGGLNIATFIRDIGSDTTVGINGAGGAAQMYFTTTNNTFAIGTDNSSFKISDSTALGTNDRFTINSSGSVGIGTASPDATVHISKAVAAGSNNTLLMLQNPTTSANVRVGIGFAINNNVGSNWDGAYIQVVNDGVSSGDMTFGNVLNSTFTEIMRTDASSGNVGIGTATPTEKLQVTGNVIVSGTITTGGLEVGTVAAINLKANLAGGNTLNGLQLVEVDGGGGDSGQILQLRDTNTANSVGPTTLTIGADNHYAAEPGMVIVAQNALHLGVGDGSNLSSQRQLTLNGTDLIYNGQNRTSGATDRTPTRTSGITVSSLTVNSAKYKQIGQMMFTSGRITVTPSSTGSFIGLSAVVGSSGLSSLSGRTGNSTLCQNYIDATSIIVGTSFTSGVSKSFMFSGFYPLS